MSARRRVGIIGAGRIGGAVGTWLGGRAGWCVTGVLVRDAAGRDGVTDDPARFLSGAPDLILDLAGPGALAAHGAAALAVADVWTVCGAALADATLSARLEEAGRVAGHRLRVMGGALGGLDMLGAARSLTLSAARPGLDEASGPMTVRQAALRYPAETSFAVAAALAGPGLDATRITLRDPGPDGDHVLTAEADTLNGTVQVRAGIAAEGRPHPVAAAVIAALRREEQVIWAG